MDDTDRTVVWRRPAASAGIVHTPEDGGHLREPVSAGEPIVNVNQPGSGYPPAPVVPTATQVAVWRAQRIIYYVFGIIQAFILIRFVLKLLAANPSSAFTQIIYNVSWVFVFPFNGVVPSFTMGGTVFEWFSIIALVVYALLSMAVAKLIGLLV